jgi:hypothetical protein
MTSLQSQDLQKGRETVEDRLQRVLRWYLFGLGVLLLGQGAGSLVRRALEYNAGWLGNGLLNADPRHAAIHIAWGSLMIGAIAFSANLRQVVGLTLVFGVFYVGLAILGTVVYHPLGLQLNLFENAFHWTVGPLTLGLGLVGLQRLRGPLAWPG